MLDTKCLFVRNRSGVGLTVFPVLNICKGGNHNGSQGTEALRVKFMVLSADQGGHMLKHNLTGVSGTRVTTPVSRVCNLTSIACRRRGEVARRSSRTTKLNSYAITVWAI